VKPPLSRKRSTLAELDRRTGWLPRRSTAASHVANHFDEMARRRAGSRRRGVFALIASNGHANGHVKAAVTARAYDHGAPILTPGRPQISRAHGAAEWAPVGLGTDGFDSTVAFAVETFDDAGRAVPNGSTEPAVVQVIDPVESAPAPPVREMPVAKALSHGMSEDGYLGLDLSSAARADDADQFEREIQDILSGKTSRPAQAASVEEGAPPVAERPLPESAHQIFEQMGQNMAYANSFDLPPIEVRRRFDVLQRELERDEALAAPPPVMSLELTDADIAEGLTMAAALPATTVVEPVAPPVPEAPAEIPTPPIVPATPDASSATTDYGRPTP
jgi:hypothetical protein